MTAAHKLLQPMLDDYQALAPQYQPIMQALAARGESVVNDHVALRTIDYPGLGIEAVAQPFLAVGWQWAPDGYRFPAKHLRARYLQPPSADLPRVFISELVLDDFDHHQAALLRDLVADQAAPLLPGCPWRVSSSVHATLAQTSEYAAWFSACGWRINHATIAVHHLKGFPNFLAFMGWVEAAGYTINASGGRIKGSAAVGLEQGSTKAPSVALPLADGEVELPGCYVEFAWRHPVDGLLFDGFIASSADKIFESTDRDQSTGQ